MVEETKAEQSKNSSLAIKLAGAAILMFGFGFAMVPLYDVFCDVTGLNGKTKGKVEIAEGDSRIQAEKERLITVQFLAMNNEGAPIDFGPKIPSIQVHPGEVKVIEYYAKNLTNYELTSQSVPSVSPLGAAEYLNKMECFCFEKQVIAVGETKDMPLRFYVDKAIPESMTKLTLNYTIFDITEGKSEKLAKTEHVHDHDHHHGQTETNLN